MSIKVYQWGLIDKESEILYNEKIVADLMFGREDAIKSVWNGDSSIVKYYHVATVDGDDKELAFELTNSIDTAWYSNPEIDVEPTAIKGSRSTSVGDVMVDDKNRVFIVDKFGFKEIKPTPKKLKM